MRIVTIFLITLFISLFFLSSSGYISNVQAQSCSGSYTSTGLYDCDYNPLSGFVCNMTGTETWNCGWYFGECSSFVFAPESCSTGGGTVCSAYNRYDGNTTSGCFLSAPPATPPPGGTPPPPICNSNGTCEGPGENCSNCSDCGSCGCCQFDADYPTDRNVNILGRVVMDQNRDTLTNDHGAASYNYIQRSAASCGAYTNVDTININFSPLCSNCAGYGPLPVNSYLNANDADPLDRCNPEPLYHLRTNERSPQGYNVSCSPPGGWFCGVNGTYNPTALVGSPSNASYNDVWFWARPNLTCSVTGPNSLIAGSSQSYTASCTGGAMGSGFSGLRFLDSTGTLLVPPILSSGAGDPRVISSSYTFTSAGTYYVYGAFQSGIADGKCSGNPFFNPNRPGYPQLPAGWIDCNGPLDAGEDFITVTVQAPPCDISIPDVILNGVGDSSSAQTVTINSGTIVSVAFSGSGVTVSPTSDSVPVFQTVVTSTALSPPTYTYTAVATSSSGGTCTDTANVSVNNPAAWWQVIGGDAISGGTSSFIESTIPSVATNPYFIQNTPGGFSGVPSAGTTLNFGSGTASVNNWQAANSSYLSTENFGYAYFENKIPGGASPPQTVPALGGNTVNGVEFESGGTVYPLVGSYYWYMYNGSGPADVLTIDRPPGLPPVNVIKLLGRRVILFVKNASVRINTPITVTKGLGGMYIISDGDIDISPNVGGDSPDIEAVLFAEGVIRTGTRVGGDIPLHIRGTLVGLADIDFQRDLFDNSTDPGELIEFAPDMLLNWPPYLTSKNITWREVAP